MLWHTFDQAPKGYGFAYDKINRLLASNYGEGDNYTDSLGYYNTAYGYDANGNITLLSRHLGGEQIDNLDYTYNGNQLHMVTDWTDKPEGYLATANPYFYEDGNGNMTTDPSKGITVDYNYLFHNPHYFQQVIKFLI
jgi:hypothetical protein